MQQLYKFFFFVAILALIGIALGLSTSSPDLWKIALVTCCVAVTITSGASPTLAGYRFTMWILIALLAAMLFPNISLKIGQFDFLRNNWLKLIVVQLVMFGMGTKMSIRDFAGVAKMPYPILIGIGLQFLIMPITGYTLAKIFGLPNEIAAGVVLIGSCSSGLASNVMCYMARANLALSISLTAIATLLAPLATPFWMEKLAGEFVEVDTKAMAMQIIKIVIIPIGAAMLHDLLKNNDDKKKKAILVSTALASILILVLGVIASQSVNSDAPLLSQSSIENCFIFSGAIAFALLYHYAAEKFRWIEEKTHLLSMAGIIYFTFVATVAGRENLLTVGLSLIAAAILHNLIGYTLGYSLSRTFGLDKESATTVAFEVGMQNGGMAFGLANEMKKLATVGLAAAVFSPWMNISGSLLANQLKKHKTFADKTSVLSND